MTICLKSNMASEEARPRKLKYLVKKSIRRRLVLSPATGALSPFHLLHQCTTDPALPMHVTGGNGRQAFPSPGAQVIEFWLRTRGVQSLGNLQISRWLLIELRPRQAHRRDPLKTVAWPTQLFRCTVGRGLILPITFERLKILFRPLPPPRGTGKGPADGPIC